jgi:opacity protein-like surface antigen
MRILVAVGSLVLGSILLSGSAFAADLIVDAPAASPVASSGWGEFYVEVYGGLTLEGTVSVDGVDADINSGTAFGASLGMMSPIEGLSFELDVMKAGGGEYVDYGEEFQTTYSLMVGAEYAVPVGDMFEIYGAAGVGVIKSVYTGYGLDYDAVGAGYQVALGARAKVTEGLAIFGEVKYQNSFEPIDIYDGSFYTYADQYPNVNVLVGLRLSF